MLSFPFKYCAVVSYSHACVRFFHEMFDKWWLSPPKLASYWLVLQLANRLVLCGGKRCKVIKGTIFRALGGSWEGTHR